jgi:hypothetical protein
MNTKYCKTCNTEKPVDEFYVHHIRQKNIKHLSSKCKSCFSEQSLICRAARKEADPLLHWATESLTRSKYRAKKYNREHTLTIEWILEQAKIVKICPLLKIELQYTNQTDSTNTASIDRKDSSKGYTPDNCKIISTRANRLKSDGTQAELEMISQNLKTY